MKIDHRLEALVEGDGRINSLKLYRLLDLKSLHSSWMWNVVKRQQWTEPTDFITSFYREKQRGRPRKILRLSTSAAGTIYIKAPETHNIITTDNENSISITGDNENNDLQVLLQQNQIVTKVIKKQLIHQQKISELDHRLDQVERIQGDTQFYCVTAWAVIRGVSYMPDDLAKPFGKECSRICKEQSIPKEWVSHKRYGRVGAYPLEVIDEAWTTPSEGMKPYMPKTLKLLTDNKSIYGVIKQ